MAVIIGGRIVSVEAKRDNPQEAPQGMTMNINIDEVVADKEMLAVSYTFSVQYHDNVGKLKIMGVLNIHEEAKKAKDVVKEWKEKKKIPEDVAEVVLNGINYTCAVNGTLFTQPLGLNAPMTLMPVRIGPKPPQAMQKGEKAA